MAVYIIQCGTDGPVKIGYSRDVYSRLRTIQTANWQEVHLIAEIGDWGEEEERVLHRHWRHRHIRGEWFNPHKDMIKDARAAVAAWEQRRMAAEVAVLNRVFATPPAPDPRRADYSEPIGPSPYLPLTKRQIAAFNRKPAQRRAR